MKECCNSDSFKVFYENIVQTIIIQKDGWLQYFELIPYENGFVFRLKDYFGGEGEKPTEFIGWYMGTDGWVENIANAYVIGEKGDAVQIRNNGEFIQWKYEGDIDWIDLVLLEDLKGDPGAEVEMQRSATHIQWRYVGDPNWIDLVALEDILGYSGWTEKTAFEEDGVDRLVKRLVGYTGGGGIPPTDNVGLYYKDDGTFTAVKAEAANFKGNKAEAILMDVNTVTGVGEIRIWTGTVQEEKDIPIKDPQVIYFSRKE